MVGVGVWEESKGGEIRRDKVTTNSLVNRHRLGVVCLPLFSLSALMGRRKEGKRKWKLKRGKAMKGRKVKKEKKRKILRNTEGKLHISIFFLLHFFFSSIPQT